MEEIKVRLVDPADLWGAALFTAYAVAVLAFGGQQNDGSVDRAIVSIYAFWLTASAWAFVSLWPDRNAEIMANDAGLHELRSGVICWNLDWNQFGGYKNSVGFPVAWLDVLDEQGQAVHRIRISPGSNFGVRNRACRRFMTELKSRHPHEDANVQFSVPPLGRWFALLGGGVPVAAVFLFAKGMPNTAFHLILPSCILGSFAILVALDCIRDKWFTIRP